MNRPIDLFELFVWSVRIILFVVLVGLLFGCITNSVSMATNPACVSLCKGESARPAASSVVIEQTIIRERSTDAYPYP
jgi:hypothetical protein